MCSLCRLTAISSKGARRRPNVNRTGNRKCLHHVSKSCQVNTFLTAIGTVYVDVLPTLLQGLVTHCLGHERLKRIVMTGGCHHTERSADMCRARLAYGTILTCRRLYVTFEEHTCTWWPFVVACMCVLIVTQHTQGPGGSITDMGSKTTP